MIGSAAYKPLLLLLRYNDVQHGGSSPTQIITYANHLGLKIATMPPPLKLPLIICRIIVAESPQFRIPYVSYKLCNTKRRKVYYTMAKFYILENNKESLEHNLESQDQLTRGRDANKLLHGVYHHLPVDKLLVTFVQIYHPSSGVRQLHTVVAHLAINLDFSTRAVEHGGQAGLVGKSHIHEIIKG